MDFLVRLVWPGLLELLRLLTALLLAILSALILTMVAFVLEDTLRKRLVRPVFHWVYDKQQGIPNRQGLNGFEAVQRLLAIGGLDGVSIKRTDGYLADGFSHRAKTLWVSSQVASSASVAALGVGAHEVSHAMQKAGLSQLRCSLASLADDGRCVGYIFFFMGIILKCLGVSQLARFLAWEGIVLSLVPLLISGSVTLLVELDASRRALQILQSSDLIIDRRKLVGTGGLLGAAAFTYVAGLLCNSAIMLIFAGLLLWLQY